FTRAGTPPPRSADECGGAPLAEPTLDRRPVADAAAELQRNFHGAENGFDSRGIHRLSGKKALEIDDVQIIKTLALERPRLRRRVAVEHGRARHVALLQAHGEPFLEIDGGKQDHGTNIITDSIAESSQSAPGQAFGSSRDEIACRKCCRAPRSR